MLDNAALHKYILYLLNDTQWSDLIGLELLCFG